MMPLQVISLGKHSYRQVQSLSGIALLQLPGLGHKVHQLTNSVLAKLFTNAIKTLLKAVIWLIVFIAWKEK